jgi:integrase/recombinase XerD
MKKHEDGYVGKITSQNPLEDHSREFRRQLESQHYAPATLGEYDRCIAILCGLMRRGQIDTGSLTESTIERLVGKIQKHRGQDRSAAFMVRRFVQYLIESGTAPRTPAVIDATAGGQLRREYESYLLNQRGLSEKTIYGCWRFADRFLQFRFMHTDADLKAITPLDIVRFMQNLSPENRPNREKTLPTHLRNFFQFLFKSGKTDINLAPSVPRMARKRGVSLPRYLSPEHVETLIAAVREDTSIGRRNYAMVLLLARLGLRAAEVVAIRVEDIDWRAGELLVRGKGQLHDRLPIPDDVGQALANYIRQDRLTTSRALFVTQRAPRVAFVNSQILNTVLSAAFDKTGLKPPTRYIGSHILRHSLATNMVRRGVPLPEITDVLRHRDRRTTMIYAKLDVEGLRSIAPAWPVAGGAK